jgi:hypothetical protein
MQHAKLILWRGADPPTRKKYHNMKGGRADIIYVGLAAVG